MNSPARRHNLQGGRNFQLKVQPRVALDWLRNESGFRAREYARRETPTRLAVLRLGYTDANGQGPDSSGPRRKVAASEDRRKMYRVTFPAEITLAAADIRQ